MLTLVESILAEFREEAPATRRMLERIPADKLSWKPHPKSRSLGELAKHVANLHGMAEKIATSDEFIAGAGTPAAVNSVEEIRAAFERNVRSGEQALKNMTEETAMGSWRLTFKGKELFRKTRAAALRTNFLNHMYHHRGQLSVYLRLLDVPLPVVYGPTADENPFV
ncbi:MAG TPA: DinB family protein [Candidatus Acidoferrales bacterium]|nr:DinB family protein [Candidatus Acidoferrales bacterium]